MRRSERAAYFFMFVILCLPRFLLPVMCSRVHLKLSAPSLAFRCFMISSVSQAEASVKCQGRWNLWSHSGLSELGLYGRLGMVARHAQDLEVTNPTCAT